MTQLHGFNIFRINCLLNDTKSTTFNSIITSILCELFYEYKNEPKNLNEIYSYIRNYLLITLEIDYLSTLINKAGFFNIEKLHDELLISLTSEKFLEVEQAIETNSLDKLINSFLIDSGKDFKFKGAIESMLYAAIYENINSFSIENLKTILPNVKQDFSKEEIDAFNAFLDYPDPEKNKAIYRVLSNAVEFAILTSGKGIKEIKFEVFKGKSFLLDTNIIFRLLGIGGEERKESTLGLLTKCLSLGIKFEYTSKTHSELTNKLDQIIRMLESNKYNGSIAILGEIVNENPDLYNDDFVIHYSKLFNQGVVQNPQQYQLKLQSDYRALLGTLKAGIVKEAPDDKEVYKLSKVLFAKKTEYYSTYGKKASEVDAYNILVVRKKRGSNNHNFSDVKSFYLTADRSLNLIISKETESIIPDTILPSQLYILCKPFFETSLDNDYSEFVKFIKRRKTGFKYGGTQVLTYINQIRKFASSVTIINETLIHYSDVRYRSSQINNEDIASNSNFTFKEVMKSILDKKLEEGDRGIRVKDSVAEEAEIYSTSRKRISRIIAKVIDCIITIGLLPIGFLIFKEFYKSLWLIALLTLLVETIKFYLSSRFKLLQRLHLFLYKILVADRVRYLARIGSDAVLKIKSKHEEILESKSIW